MTRYGFLYLHDIHHVYHSAPIAFELSKLDLNAHVTLYCSSKATFQAAQRIKYNYPESSCNILELKPPFLFRYFNVGRKSYTPPKRTMQNYSSLFNKIDIIVGTSFDTLWLKEEFNVTRPRLVFTFHGAGDGAYGFKKSLSNFDLLLLSGEKVEQRLKTLGVLEKTESAVVGYPKFDLFSERTSVSRKFFSNDRISVIYNPHWNRRLSSWYDWGEDILEFFANSTNYNLVFAPHLLLKEWKGRHLKLRKYKKFSNILIDYGSWESVEMTYTLGCDLYLGDVSSQVYEFLQHPRPCIFLNNSLVDWKGNPDYLFWKVGLVIDELSKLDGALEKSQNVHKEYRPIQEKLFSDTFDLNKQPSSLRAAHVLVEFARKP